MSTWNDGYTTDIGYTHGYYVELNPNRIEMALLSAGLLPPKINHACELGFGQGVSINIHAATTTGLWYGNDFNPSQASYATQLADGALKNIHIFEDSFVEFYQRDLPKFDFIALHGIWSWISDQNRQQIVRFIGKNLAVGGVVYMSYNTLPGWSSFVPVRHLLSTHNQKLGTEGTPVVDKINASLEFVQTLFKSDPKFLKNNEVPKKRLEELKNQRSEYLAHEYFNKNWFPAYFSEVESVLADAKLSYACSANFLDHIAAINHTQEQQKYLNTIADTSLRETARDFLVNQSFRRDYWIKGPVQLSPFEKLARIRSQRFIYSHQKVKLPISVKGALGEAKLLDKIYSPILNLMEDYQIRTFEEIEQGLGSAAPNSQRLIEAILILCGANILSPAQCEKDIGLASQSTDALNKKILDQVLIDGPVKFLASPVTGGGIYVGNLEKMFILAIREGLEGAPSLVNYAKKIMQSLNQTMLRDGKPVPNDQVLNELSARVAEFETASLPLLRALKIV